MAELKESWRFAVGTLTAWPVKPPRSAAPEITGPAMLLAPLAVVPLGVLVALVGWAGGVLGLAPIGTAAAAVTALAMGSRAFHLDGLADTADGLTASYDRVRSLAVMRTGDTGPAGAGALVLVLGVQIGSLTALLPAPYGPVLAGIAVCVSRGAVLLTCQRSVPGARSDGLGSTYVGAVSPVAGVVGWLLLTGALTCGFLLMGEPWWRGPAATLAAALAVALIVRRAVSRLGGVTGDVYGASIEASLAVLLLAST